ncbi:hypothetical protein KR059_002865 [Drosophila kikkawai]|nr:hypothetical protein KR059_002865 [Drosophila kikkawai]
MDLFIRKELVLASGTQLEDVVPHCLKLLAWLRACQEEMLSQHRRLRLSQSLVESMVKATLYLFECHDRFGEALAERCDSHGFFGDKRQECIRELCAGIVNTRRGEEHAPLLHLMHKALAEIQPAWSVIRDLDWTQMRHSEALTSEDMVSVDLQQMRRLVKRIGRLASLQDMETALQRSLQLVGFQVWLHLFREPRESGIHLDCHLLRHMICDTLTEGTSSACASFLHNIFTFVALPANEMRFWACLEHGRLASSLIAYLIGYWSRQLPYLDLEEMQLTPEAPVLQTAQLPVNEATYVTHLMLAPCSPCRQQFRQQLRPLLPTAAGGQLLQLLNKVAYVYS